MFKRVCLLIIIVFICFAAKAQSADSVYSQYLDFNVERLQGNQDRVIELGENILPNAGKLPEKARINFYFAIGKMYEDDNQFNKATQYYEKVAAAVPDYYVVHRALGYIYLDKAKNIEQQLNAADADKALADKLTLAYADAVKKALPHLEKAQACDPSDETLTIIKQLYEKLKDTNGEDSLNNRLKALNKNCIDILNDK